MIRPAVFGAMSTCVASMDPEPRRRSRSDPLRGSTKYTITATATRTSAASAIRGGLRRSDFMSGSLLGGTTAARGRAGDQTLKDQARHLAGDGIGGVALVERLRIV